MKSDPNKLLSLVGTVLGLLFTVAGLVTDAKILPWLYWIGTAVLFMFVADGLVTLAYGAWTSLTKTETKPEPTHQEERAYFWLLGIGAVAGVIFALIAIDDPSSKGEARHFGFFHLFGLAALIGATVLFCFVYIDSRSETHKSE
jgi:hypothetical protein